MDYFPKVVLSVFLLCLHSMAFANFPAKEVKNSYCFQGTANVTSYACSSPSFDSAAQAAAYGCQTHGTAFGVKTVTHLPSEQNPGLTAWGTFKWSVLCVNNNNGQTQGLVDAQVQAAAECTGGAPIGNYAPATCSGNPPPPPPVSCSSLTGVVISAFHRTPAVLIGCYAGCAYNARDVVIGDYNGVQYESGTWVGNGDTCSSNAALTTGTPSNSGGLVPSDLGNLAKEVTLQQVLQAIQQGSTTSSSAASQNKTLLEQIATNTAAGAAPAPTTVPDPDGFESEYNAKLAANQVDSEGKLPASAIPNSTVDVSNTFSNVSGFIGNRSCPIPPSFSVKGHTYQFDMTSICGLAEGLSYLVVVLASISGVRIFTGGM